MLKILKELQLRYLSCTVIVIVLSVTTNKIITTVVAYHSHKPNSTQPNLDAG